jgi:hypothetical protein
MSQDSPPRMKIAGLFSAESPMRLAHTTMHDNSSFQRSIFPYLQGGYVKNPGFLVRVTIITSFIQR